MTAVKKLSISTDQSGQRLDNFLRKSLKSIPKSLLYKIIRDGQVRVNMKRTQPSYRIQCDDIIRIPPLIDKTRASTQQTHVKELIEKNIIFEDKDLLVLNKPSGIAVHSGTKIKTNIISLLRDMPTYKDITLVHRIDKYTSGCLILAKNYKTASSVGNLFTTKAVSKKYIALLAGRIKKKEFYVTKSLKKEKILGIKKMTVSENGKEAITEYKVQKTFNRSTLVEVIIKTGRTHQIRAHSAEIGYPICGDMKYGDKNINKDFKKIGLHRIFLHSSEISFFYKKQYNFTAKTPFDLTNILDTINKN